MVICILVLVSLDIDSKITFENIVIHVVWKQINEMKTSAPHLGPVFRLYYRLAKSHFTL